MFNGEYAALQLHHNTNHIENNLLSQFKCGDVPREQFHKAVNSFTRTDKLKHMGEIRKISRAAAEYLEAIDQKLLFRADAEFPKYGILTNMAETMNGVSARGTTRLNLLKKNGKGGAEWRCSFCRYLIGMYNSAVCTTVII